MSAPTKTANHLEVSLYRLGWITWVWRPMIFLALAGGGFFAALSLVHRSWDLVFIGAPVALPALFFGFVVAARIEQRDGEELHVETLIFWRRRIHRSRLRPAKYRSKAYTEFSTVFAPRAWIPVKKGLPIYLDLYGKIPDPKKFRDIFGRQLRLPART